MRRTRSAAGCLASATILLGGIGAAEGSGVPEFNAFLVPDTVFTEVDSLFTVDFWVDSTAQHFNGYDVTVQWDPAVVESVVSATQGALFTGNPCGPSGTIAFESQTDSTHTFEHVILCAGYFADGPGVLHTYTFRAGGAGVGALSFVSDPNYTFADSGNWVNPDHPTFPRQVFLHDAVVVVTGGATDAPDLASSPPAFGFFPNPTRAGGVFRFAAQGDGPVFLDVLDAAGRRVLRRAWKRAPPGEIRWSGREAGGRLLPAGVYFARLETVSGTAVRKVVLLR